MGLGQVGVESDSLAQDADRLVNKPLIVQGAAEVALVIGDVGLDGNRLANPLDGLVRLTALNGDDAQQVQGIGIVWLLRQHVKILRLGLREPASPVKANRLLHDLIYIVLAHFSVFPTATDSSGYGGRDKHVPGAVRTWLTHGPGG